MKTATTIKEVRSGINEAKKRGSTVGFVPTMGYLHEGHLSLIKEARQQNDFVVVSIFVNPLQFGQNEDFDRYPKDMERDEELARTAGVDLIFHPSVEEMYPTKPAMTIQVQQGVDVLCGTSRPGHFDGVATVVMKLFQIVQADTAYFGQKDAQQAAIIMNMVDTFNLPMEISICETVREEDGLAKSSRNVYLSESERKEAPMLYETLKYGADLIQTKTMEQDEIIRAMVEKLNGGSGKLDYLDILAYPSLERAAEYKGRIIIAVAYQYERARLIDNYLLEV